MRPVSQLLRGRFYTTHLTARCSEYHRCAVCGGCRHYDRNSLVCVNCELYKPTPHCRCKPSSLLAVRLITKRLGYEMQHPDMPKRGAITTLEEDESLLRFIEQNIGTVESQ